MTGLPNDPTELPIFGGPPRGVEPDGPTLNPITQMRRPAAHALAGPIESPPATHRPRLVPVDTPVAPPAPRVPSPPHRAGGLDWQQVAMLRSQASDQLTAALASSGRGTDPETEKELGRAIIQELLQATVTDRLHDGETAWAVEEQDRVADAVFNALFGLGRLQPLVDDDTVENIIITGAANVWVEKIDGTLVRVDPVADSDQELLDFLAFVASRSEVNARSFSTANPRLHMRLDGGSRLAAAAWVTAQPSVVIRRHRLRQVTLDELVGRRMISEVQASFLRAAIKARKSVVVSGPQAAGKALALDTAVPTPSGWTTMGALNAGDQVFAEDGTPCNVIAAHDYQYDRPCYEVKFDDGTTVIADADHLWRVTRRSHREAASPRVQGSYKNTPAYYVDQAERARLWTLVEEVNNDPDLQVTIAEFAAEAGETHRALIHQHAQQMTPGGHTYVSWTGSDGRRGGRATLTYSRQELAKSLAVARDKPRYARPRRPESVVLTTSEIAQSPLWIHGDKRWRTHDFAIDLAQPIQYETAVQQIDPYVLGIWLGDGATASARVTTADPEVLDELASAGYPCTKISNTKYDYRVGGNLHTKLRSAGLLGDKHIPANYLRGSVAQRLALLQGLMDSDGTCSKSGSSSFSSTLQLLAEQAYELVSSLGYRPTLTSKPVKWKGEVIGTAWNVAWTTHDAMFRLPRKLQRQSNSARGGPTRRYIVAVRQVPSVPVRCITVDSPSSLFLVTKGHVATHNTTLVRALCAEINPWEAIGTFETEFELHLHELKDIHPIVHAWEARPGSGEVGPDGRQAGEFTLDEALYDSFRFNLSRQIVGEVRGREVWAMIKAMESGAGSISTTHAADGEAAIRKLVTCAMEAGSHITKDLVVSKLAETIDLIVQVHLETVPLGNNKWRRSRWVSEIIHVSPGEAAKGYATTHVFRPNPAGGPALPGTLPDELRSLEDYGFDVGSYLADNGREEIAG